MSIYPGLCTATGNDPQKVCDDSCDNIQLYNYPVTKISEEKTFLHDCLELLKRSLQNF